MGYNTRHIGRVLKSNKVVKKATTVVLLALAAGLLAGGIHAFRNRTTSAETPIDNSSYSMSVDQNNWNTPGNADMVEDQYYDQNQGGSQNQDVNQNGGASHDVVVEDWEQSQGQSTGSSEVATPPVIEETNPGDYEIVDDSPVIDEGQSYVNDGASAGSDVVIEDKNTGADEILDYLNDKYSEQTKEEEHDLPADWQEYLGIGQSNENHGNDEVIEEENGSSQTEQGNFEYEQGGSGLEQGENQDQNKNGNGGDQVISEDEWNKLAGEMEILEP